MQTRDAAHTSTTGGLAIAPSMAPTVESLALPSRDPTLGRRTVTISLLAMAVAVAAGLVAQLLTTLITVVTNVAFFGSAATLARSPAEHTLGPMVILVPVAGGVVVGLMARYGSTAIRGHGIPEAMEQVLFHASRIPARITFLKPLSAAIAIGTGGPFGAEGPIIATGGALGSLLGQLLRTTAEERKVLLSAGAAAGMAATFGAPVSAVLLAIELLLFEYRPRSVIPVALATSVATGVRLAFVGGAPMFAMPEVLAPTSTALAFYVLVGAVAGLTSVGVTRAVYAMEDAFAKLPVHWMWWPALGAVAVGLVGWWSPRTLGVGYDNIEQMLDASLLGRTMVVLCALKFVSWSIALGSGTSGGTLAPLFTFGAGLGSALGAAGQLLLPTAAIDLRVAALVGMAAIFAGASRALLASVVFAFETTRQPMGLLPLLAGCSASFLLSALVMRNSIMTEKLARRGVAVNSEYAIDPYAHMLVRDHMVTEVVTLSADITVDEARLWSSSAVPGTEHQGFPVVADGALIGVLTHRDLRTAASAEVPLGELVRRPPIVAFDDETLRDATDKLVRADVGRLPVVRRGAPDRLVGILTRSDLLRARGRHLEGETRAEQRVNW